jgi:hypothetical protein
MLLTGNAPGTGEVSEKSGEISRLPAGPGAALPRVQGRTTDVFGEGVVSGRVLRRGSRASAGGGGGGGVNSAGEQTPGEAVAGRLSLGVRTVLTRGERGRGGGRSEGERPGGEPHVLEDGLRGGEAKDDGDDAPDAAAALAVEDVGLERPFEELGPGDGAPRRPGRGRAVCRARGAPRPRPGDDGGADADVRGEVAKVADAGWPWEAERARRGGGGRPPERRRGASVRRRAPSEPQARPSTPGRRRSPDLARESSCAR